MSDFVSAGGQRITFALRDPILNAYRDATWIEGDGKYDISFTPDLNYTEVVLLLYKGTYNSSVSDVIVNIEQLPVASISTTEKVYGVEEVYVQDFTKWNNNNNAATILTIAANKVRLDLNGNAGDYRAYIYRTYYSYKPWRIRVNSSFADGVVSLRSYPAGFFATIPLPQDGEVVIPSADAGLWDIFIVAVGNLTGWIEIEQLPIAAPVLCFKNVHFVLK